MDDLQALTELFRRLATIQGAEDKHLAIAADVSPPTVTGWRRMMKGKESPRLNDSSREAIKLLLGTGDDYITPGMELAVGKMKATVDDLAMAVQVRRALRSETSGAPSGERSPGGKAASRALQREAEREGKSKPRKAAGRKGVK